MIQILIFIGFAWAANSQTDQNLPGPILSFEESYHDFETIVQGEIVDYVFKFINKGDRPLVISNVLTSCGCTASEWPKTPIEPGSEGVIKATFNSRGKFGQQKKIITVLSNAPNNRMEIVIKAFVLPKRSNF